ncbi:diguanylate cyclase [Microvirga tunisiensis]|uniref:diguanylate cyclase n=2 Tax=Pannonibacter tanglangensis TaxID=2750084 RepID=A0A7X5F084_9HYPH|nr:MULTISPECIES: GGDEF domain-containing protein [unclassified Pannonibacter]NBN63730.1 diguanylate cyclase [Pannonibacter sp. XCT-34]NBN77377.1 diguanylate cyclase [Pannonibacter sp. XCT-53]
MTPDARTLFVVIALLSFGAGFLLLGLWSGMRHRQGLRTWAISLWVRAPGFLLLAGRGTVPLWLTVDVSNALMCVGSGFGYVAARELSGARLSPLARGLICFGPAVAWLAGCWMPALYDDVTLRTLAVALPLGAYALATAWAFLGLAQTSRRVRLGFSVLWLIGASGHFARAGLVLVVPPDPQVMNPSPLFTLTLLVPILAFTLGLFWIGFLYREWTLTELQRHAERDWLTGVLNRAGFLRLARARLPVGGGGGGGAVLLLDLDHFKAINDRHGHATGDRVLMAFCRRAEVTLPPSAVLGRIGGEEFAVALAPGCPDPVAVGERLRAALAERPPLEDLPDVRVTVSAGVAISPAPGLPLEVLLNGADAALYEAKSRGRDRVCVWNVDPRAGARASGPLAGASAGAGMA